MPDRDKKRTTILTFKINSLH